VNLKLLLFIELKHVISCYMRHKSNADTMEYIVHLCYLSRHTSEAYILIELRRSRINGGA
jgi:hypothetical protein